MRPPRLVAGPLPCVVELLPSADSHEVMGQAVDDQLQPANDLTLTLAEFQSSEGCFSKAFHASPFVKTVSRFDSGRYLYVNDSFVKAEGLSSRRGNRENSNCPGQFGLITTLAENPT